MTMAVMKLLSLSLSFSFSLSLYTYIIKTNEYHRNISYIYYSIYISDKYDKYKLIIVILCEFISHCSKLNRVCEFFSDCANFVPIVRIVRICSDFT